MSEKIRQHPKWIPWAPLEAHRSQTLWQIILPLVLTALLIALLGGLAAQSTFGDASFGAHWSSISLMVILIPLCVAGIVAFVALILLILGVAKLQHALPLFTGLARTKVYQIEILVWSLMNRVVQPIIAFHTVLAALKRGFKLLRPSKSS